MAAIPGGHRKELILGLLRALRYLHSQRTPVVHADLKPENVLVEWMDGYPRSKLADFGLSRLFKPSGTSWTDAKKGGTPRWASPEVLLWLIEDNSPENLIGLPTVDTYSFAVLSYFISSNILPMSDIDSKQLIDILRKTGLPPPLDWPSYLHELRVVLAGCMVMPPQQRTCLASLQVEIEKLADEDFERKDVLDL
eukprot:gnl/MRDRNA2_/MRDRNA2_72305_c0_seq2.p1 gnl/MRDRNA2_/MRDRNA2_72305_c0~~gnl/MRDRNA2_/MRDRNA2_72305_c0_seq2.p1  ORF type:complete len:214 (-),score=45.09 gnl/MRDRNA2_/MRDRNA2_72305_c0_seq2:143-727(-)